MTTTITAPAAADALAIRRRAHAMRRTVLEMCRGRGQGYAGQGLALADLMACLYFSAMQRDADERLIDRFVLSTGHSAIAVFAAMLELGLYELDELRTYGMDGSRIEESPLEGTPGFEITGGSLGQGLSQAVGMAIGERLRGSGARVFCLVSDGELQEGQTWEAAMAAAHHRLDNLILLVDNNGIQADGATADVLGVEPVTDKLASFGFAAERVDPHDVEALLDALRRRPDKPLGLVLQTIPGQGVPSFVTSQKVHYIRAADEVWEQALIELDEAADPQVR
jgi:transketolase